MTKLSGMTSNEIWEQIEDCFYGVLGDVGNRCYSVRSVTGTRYVQLSVRRHLAWIDRALLEIEARMNIEARINTDKTEVEQVLERVKEGLATAADAEFVRKLLYSKSKKGVPKKEKRRFTYERPSGGGSGG